MAKKNSYQLSFTRELIKAKKYNESDKISYRLALENLAITYSVFNFPSDKDHYQKLLTNLENTSSLNLTFKMNYEKILLLFNMLEKALKKENFSQETIFINKTYFSLLKNENKDFSFYLIKDKKLASFPFSKNNLERFKNLLDEKVVSPEKAKIQSIYNDILENF